MIPVIQSPAERPMFDVSLMRRMIAVTLAGLVIFLSTSFAGAGTLVPLVDTGGSGGGGLTVADMLRGDLSPVAIVEEVVEEPATLTVAEMLRGGNSPVDAAPEIAVTETQGELTVAEMLGGGQSPIVSGVV